MTFIINNDDVARVLTMDATIDALETAYRQLISGEAVCRPRIDIQIPTPEAGKTYQWGTMEGGSTSGYFAIRMKSDVVYEREYAGAITQEKYCLRPGLYCGLVLLTDIRTGEPLAFINDGVLQHMRVGADGAIGAKYMARKDASTIGMLGSGGMARAHVEALCCVRDIRKLQVFSPTRAHREAFGSEMAKKHGLEVVVCDRPDDVYRGADIVCGATDSAVPVIEAGRIEKGTHIINVGGGGKPDTDTLARVDAYLRFGNTPAPWGLPELAISDQYITWAARPDPGSTARTKKYGKRAHGMTTTRNVVYLADIVEGRSTGRTSDEQITYSERGNVQGAQFFAVAGRVYELAREAGLGREIPTEWFLQDIRD
jgi:alanine dehydrogenase